MTDRASTLCRSVGQPFLLWRVTRLGRKAEEARRHKSQDHLCRHDRPARGGGFGTAVKMRAEDTSIAQTEL
jgi:hypothetical protein